MKLSGPKFTRKSQPGCKCINFVKLTLKKFNFKNTGRNISIYTCYCCMLYTYVHTQKIWGIKDISNDHQLSNYPNSHSQKLTSRYHQGFSVCTLVIKIRPFEYPLGYNCPPAPIQTEPASQGAHDKDQRGCNESKKYGV